MNSDTVLIYYITKRLVQIFELEDSDAGDADESALDMSDAGPIPPIDIRARRVSQASRPRVSQSSTSGAPRPSPPESPRKAERSSPSPGHIPLPRTRLASLVTRLQDGGAQGAPSPLAQVFQPLIVNNDHALDENGYDQHQSDGSSQPTSGISYGPATRRRLSSQVQSQHQQQQQQQQHRRGMSTGTGDSFVPGSHSPLGQSSALGLNMRRFPPMPASSVVGAAAKAPGLETIASGQVSESPDIHAEPIETASQIEEEGPNGAVEKQLERLEKRQKRIEELLVQLTEQLEQRAS